MKKLVALLAVLSVLFTACRTDTTVDTGSTTAPTADSATGDDAASSQGSDDAADQDADSAPTPSPEAATEPTATAASTPSASSGAASSDQAAAARAAALQAVADADDWCQAAAVVESDLGELDVIDFTDPELLKATFTQVLAVVSAAQRLAPPEIAADVATTVQAFTRIIAALEDANWSFLDLDLSIIEEFDGPVQLASYNIEKYNYEVCGIGTDPGEPPTADELRTDLGDDLELEGTIRDQAVQGLVQSGFSEDEAICLLESLDITDPEAFADTTALLNVFTECGLSFDRLAELGQG